MIRHTAVDVPAGYAYGQTDVPLKATFPEEAACVKQSLEGHTFDQVWSSPLSRCRRLATFCGYPEPMTDPRLMEVNFGEWVPVSFHVAEDSRLYRRLLWGDLLADGTELLFGYFIVISSIVMGYGGIFDSTYSC